MIEDFEVESEAQDEEDLLKDMPVLDKELEKMEELNIEMDAHDKELDDRISKANQINEEIKQKLNKNNEMSDLDTEFDSKELSNDGLFNKFSNEKIKNL